MQKIEIFSFEGDREGAYAASHYFKTPDGIILFDGQLLKDQAEDLLIQIREDIPSSTLSSIIVTSAAPEHCASLNVIKSKVDAGVYSTQRTEENIAGGAVMRLAQLKTKYGLRAPDDIVLADHTIRSSQQFKWKGLELQFYDIGIREPSGNLVCFLPEKRRLITGDLVFNKVHPFLERVDIDSWERSLDILSTFGAKTIFPGHGPVAGNDVLTHLKRYLDHFRLAVAHFTKTESAPNETVINGVKNLMHDKYPDYRLPENLTPGIMIEFERQIGKRAA
jgi:glyoxylase-like metal-dependent hydrolase (beta-lactamase superfamily II)